VCLINPAAGKPLIPARLKFYAALKRHGRAIRSLECRSAFLQAPEALLAVQKWDWESLCFWFPGVENPLRQSRYRYAAPFWRLFDKALFSALDRVDVLMAAADENAINHLLARSRGRLARDRVHQVPTCVDTSEFRTEPVSQARARLGIPSGCRVFVNSGRIARLKGWDLLVDAIDEYRRHDPDVRLYFAGDGEDQPVLEKRIADRHLEAHVKITGFLKPLEMASYINAADVAVFGSFVEGWSVSMLEALACGKAIVSTGVSGANSMVISGENGFIVTSRDPLEFARAMRQAVALPNATSVSVSVVSNFDLCRMGEQLGRLWSPFGQREQSNANSTGPQLLRVIGSER
jgi:glycosyltransferase involved in cell wall biosynthesis